MTSTRSIATSTLWQIASQFTMAALSTLSVKFVAIGLSRELAGSYNSAYGFLQLFAILADFGLYAVSVREVSRVTDGREQGKVLGALIVLRCAIMTLSLGTALAVAWLVPAWRATPLPVGIALAAFVPFFTLLAGVLRTVFQVTYKMHLIFVSEVTQRIVSTALMAIPIVLGVRLTSDPLYYNYFLAAGGIGAAVLFALSFVFAVRLLPIRPCFDAPLLRRLLIAAMPYGVAYLCVALYRQFDLTMIALLRPDFQLQNAYYGFAGRITEMTYIVPTFLLNSTLPVLSRRHAQGEKTDRLLGKTLLSVLVIGSTAALFSALWARPVMQLLTSDAYLSSPEGPGADTALALLSMPQFLNGLVMYSFYVLLTLHEWRSLVRTMLAGVAMSIALNILLIPHYGFAGAAITSTAVHALLAALLFPQALKRMKVALPRRLLLTWVQFTVCTALLLAALRSLLTDELRTVAGALIVVPILTGACLALGLHRALLRDAVHPAQS